MVLICILCKIRSGLKVYPVNKLGDGNEGRSVSIDQSGKYGRFFERHKRNDLLISNLLISKSII